MGQQQLLLIIVCLIVVGIGIATGIALFGATSIETNKQAILSDLNNLASTAYQHRIRPSSMGGGGGTYTGGNGFMIPALLQTNDNGNFMARNAAQSITFVVSSAQGYGTITATCDSTGQLGNFTYTGEFL